MPTFKEFFGIKPKEEINQSKHGHGTAPEELVAEKAEIQENRERELEEAKREDEARIVEAKQRFKNEKQKLEHRLWEIPNKIKELEGGLTKMRGPDMRKILDKEAKLNSALSLIDSTDPRGKKREQGEWVQALHESRDATQITKADLGKLIDEYQGEISELEKEKREIESRIQRGY